MNIQEAYNLGLTNAENGVIETINTYIETGSYEPFLNPALEDVWQKLITATSSQQERGDDFRDKLYSTLSGADVPTDTEKDKTLLEVVKARSDHYISICGGKSRLGKEFKKKLDQQLQSLQSILK